MQALAFVLSSALIAVTLTPSVAAAAKTCKVTRKFEDQLWTIRMTVSSDGGPCSARLDYTATARSGTIPKNPSSSQVTEAVKHGTVAFQFDQNASTLDYTPTRGFAGRDRMEMRFNSSPWPWVLDVTVEP